MKNKINIIAILMIFLIIISPIILPAGGEITGADKFMAPSLKHIFGTDNFGRDLFVRTVLGFRYTFILVSIVLAVSIPLALVIGVLLGYYGGILDEIFYYIANMILSFPIIIIAMLVVGLTNSGTWAIIVLLSVYNTISNSKLVRSEAKIIKNNDYILNLKILGANDWMIIKDHLIGKCFKLIRPTISISIGHMIISISTFSFLGYGVKPPQPEIGTMLKESMRFISRAPWLMFFPGLFQFTIILMIMNLSDYKRDKAGGELWIY
ncbi:MAG: ABC transporter permease [Tissierellia bacterium]|nr:ABC transporter permease [Tissierellia bacterium]